MSTIKIKTYTIRGRHDGAQEFHNVDNLFDTSFAGAKLQFRKWVLDVLSTMNSDHADAEYASILYSRKGFDTWRWDATKYSIRKDV